VRKNFSARPRTYEALRGYPEERGGIIDPENPNLKEVLGAANLRKGKGSIDNKRKPAWPAKGWGALACKMKGKKGILCEGRKSLSRRSAPAPQRRAKTRDPHIGGKHAVGGAPSH